MDKTQSDLVEWYELETEFFQDYVRHTKYVGKAKNRNEKVKEDWRNCQELERGGFGVVYKQIQESTGDCRAVKTIDKRSCTMAVYSRELVVMAILAKVGVLILPTTPRELSCRGLMLSCLASIVICGVFGVVRGARDSVYCDGISRARRSYQTYRYTTTPRNRSKYFKADTRGSQ